MAVNARDLPEARMRRWVAHGVLGALFVASVGWAWSTHSRVAELDERRRQATESIPGLEEAADEVATQCDLPPFSDPESLKSFPMKIPRFPTKREKECGDRVTKARSDLIETYLEIDRVRPLLADARDAAGPTIPIALMLGAILGVWLWLGELRHRRGAA